MDRGQRVPVLIRQQRAEAEIAEFFGLRRFERQTIVSFQSRQRSHGKHSRYAFFFIPGRKFKTFAPSLIAVAICGFGTLSIWV